MGPKNYAEFEAYATAPDKNAAVIGKNKDGIKQLIDIVKKIREAQDNNFLAVNVEGYDHQPRTFVLRLNIDTGVFNKCGNYAPLFTEEVALQPTEQVLRALTTEVTTVSNPKIEVIKNYYGFTGGISGRFNVTTGPGGGGDNPTSPDGGPGGSDSVDKEAHPYQEGPTGTGASALTKN